MRITRWDVILIVLLVLSCIGIILSRYHARKAYFALTQEHEISRNLDTRFGQLQLEESTDSMRFHLQQVAERRLGLFPPRKTHSLEIRSLVGTR